jgi:hypothetical protein
MMSTRGRADRYASWGPVHFKHWRKDLPAFNGTLGRHEPLCANGAYNLWWTDDWSEVTCKQCRKARIMKRMHNRLWSMIADSILDEIEAEEVYA